MYTSTMIHQFINSRCGIWICAGKSGSPADRHVPNDRCGGSLRTSVLCGPASNRLGEGALVLSCDLEASEEAVSYRIH